MTQEPQPQPHTARRTVTILNGYGLHLRPADKFVRLAVTFQAEIRVYFKGNQYNGKSILYLTTLAADRNSELVLEALGPDAEAALTALAELVSARFHEDDEGRPEESAHEVEAGRRGREAPRPVADRPDRC